MKKILAFLLILSTIFFIGCNNNVTNSTSGGGNQGGSGGSTTSPDGLASTHDGTWYFYSEDGTVKDLVVTIANGGITGLKTSSVAMDLAKENLSSKFLNLIKDFSDCNNYVLYKDGYTGNMNFKDKIAYVKIKDSSKNVVIEGMLSAEKRTTVISDTVLGIYNGQGNKETLKDQKRKLTAEADLITFEATDKNGSTTIYKFPAAYLTKDANSETYTCDALNYRGTTLDFDTPAFALKYINANYSVADANFSTVTDNSGSFSLSSLTGFTYTKEGEQQ